MEQNDHFIPDGMNDFERSVKRVGDCLLAFIGLIIFSPLFLICYLAVKHEDGGAYDQDFHFIFAPLSTLLYQIPLFLLFHPPLSLCHWQ